MSLDPGAHLIGGPRRAGVVGEDRGVAPGRREVVAVPVQSLPVCPSEQVFQTSPVTLSFVV